MEQRFVQLYTGNGKGKTSAAFGMAVRALCSGMKVYIGQFVKSMEYNETGLACHFPSLKVEQYGQGCFYNDPGPQDRELAVKGLETAAEYLSSGEYGLVILDELTIALYYGLVGFPQVEQLLSQRHPATEVIITGRYAPPELTNICDLVTDMREVKHYHALGVLSRDGYDK